MTDQKPIIITHDTIIQVLRMVIDNINHVLSGNSNIHEC